MTGSILDSDSRFRFGIPILDSDSEFPIPILGSDSEFPIPILDRDSYSGFESGSNAGIGIRIENAGIGIRIENAGIGIRIENRESESESRMGNRNLN
jgi:hypothetical protein